MPHASDKLTAVLAGSSKLATVFAVIRLMRLKQWVKNTFLFIPLFFAGQFFNTTAFLYLLVGFFAYSFVASAVYIINDYNDIEADRAHPEKCKRPLASGEVGVPLAFVLMSLLIGGGLGTAFIINISFFWVLLGYLLLNVAYSQGLKHVALLDIFIVASGFLLRVLGGGFLAKVPVSQWLIVMVFLLALFLAFAKRRDDILLFQQSGKQMRKSVKNYNLEFLGACLTMLSAIIMVSYVMYTLSEDVIARLNTNYLYITSVFVIAGMMRYLQITMVENNSGSPTKILYRDTFIRVTILCWIFSFFIILYIPRI